MDGCAELRWVRVAALPFSHPRLGQERARDVGDRHSDSRTVRTRNQHRGPRSGTSPSLKGVGLCVKKHTVGVRLTDF